MNLSNVSSRLDELTEPEAKRKSLNWWVSCSHLVMLKIYLDKAGVTIPTTDEFINFTGLSGIPFVKPDWHKCQEVGQHLREWVTELAGGDPVKLYNHLHCEDDTASYLEPTEGHRLKRADDLEGFETDAQVVIVWYALCEVLR